MSNRMGATLGHVVCPIQTIWGERDALPYPNVHAHIEVYRRAVPGIRVDIVPGASYMISGTPAADLR